MYIYAGLLYVAKFNLIECSTILNDFEIASFLSVHCIIDICTKLTFLKFCRLCVVNVYRSLHSQLHELSIMDSTSLFHSAQWNATIPVSHT